MMEAIRIDGVATCDEGRIMLRLYDGAGASREFIGVARAFIGGRIFKATGPGVPKPAALPIEYSIGQR